MEERTLGRRSEKPELIENAAIIFHPAIKTAASIVNGEINYNIPEDCNAVCIKARETLSDLTLKTDLGKYSPENLYSAAVFTGTWLSEPRTIREFQVLKYVLMSISENDDLRAVTAFPEKRSEILTWGYRSDWLINRNPGYAETYELFLEMAGKLKIIQKERMKHEYDHEGVSSEDQLWRRIEGDNAWENPRAVVHKDIEDLEMDLSAFRQLTYLKTFTPRVGLMFGDFRVGFHPDHSRLAANAKVALGRDGRLVVVSPTAMVIRKVNHKSTVWDDGIREALIANDRSVSDLHISEMPEEMYSHPNDHWANVWEKIRPDLVFLGEVNHPLEPVYRYQSKRLGGLLLIDDSIGNGIRSGVLLKD